MADYSEEELLEFSRKDARKELTDEQFKRYNSLKAQQLEESVDEYKEDKAQVNAEGLDKLLGDARDDMQETVELFGNELEVLVDPDETDFRELRKLKNKADIDDEDLSDEEVEDLKDTMFEFMGQFTVNYTSEDWKDKYEGKDVGIRTIMSIAYEMFDTVEDAVKQKKRR